MSRSLLLALLLLLTRPVHAQRAADSMKAILAKTHSAKDSMQLITQIGVVFLKQETKETGPIAVLYFEQAISMARRLNDKKALVTALSWLGNSYTGKDNPKAQQLLGQAVQTARANRDAAGEALALVRLGGVISYTDNAKAIGLFNESMRLFTLLNDSAGMARVWEQFALVYQTEGNYKQAIEYHLRALGIIEKEGTTIQLAYLMENLGDVHELLDNHDVALAYYTKAGKIALALSAETLIYSSLQEIGSIYSQRNEFTKAASNYQEALDRSIRNNDTLTEARCLRLLGNMYVAKGEDAKAVDYLVRALDRIRQYSNQQNIEDKCLILASLADAYHEQKAYRTALAVADTLVRIAQEINFTEGLKFGCQLEAESYASLGNFGKAYEFRLKFETIKDSLYSLEKNRQITEMQTRYETGNKAHEIVLLNKDKEVMESRISRKNFAIAGIVSGGVLALLSVGLLYNRRNLLNRNRHAVEMNAQQQQMTLAILGAQEEERQGIARDMHDSLGAYLASLKINMEVLQPVIPDDKQPIYHNMVSALGKVTEEMRSIARNLVSDTLQHYGLEIAVEELAELINMSGKMTVTYTSEGFSQRLPIALETSVFRIIQELLNNTIKHAKATAVDLHLGESDGMVIVTFSDNGIGFDRAATADKRNGIGMKNMEARTAVLKGVFRVSSAPGTGSQFKIEIPFTFA